MFKAFRKIFEKKSSIPKNNYRDILSLSEGCDNNIKNYSLVASVAVNEAELSLLENKTKASSKLFVDVKGSDFKEKSQDFNNCGMNNTIKNEFTRNRDFKSLVTHLKVCDQKKNWDQQFKRTSTSMLNKYIEQISIHISDDTKLKFVFNELNMELKNLKISRESFFKDLIKGLYNQKIPFTNKLNEGLQSLLSESKRGGSSFVEKVSQTRKYCLGSSNKISR